jgi:hypothetical protein
MNVAEKKRGAWLNHTRPLTDKSIFRVPQGSPPYRQKCRCPIMKLFPECFNPPDLRTCRACGVCRKEFEKASKLKRRESDNATHYREAHRLGSPANCMVAHFYFCRLTQSATLVNSCQSCNTQSGAFSDYL